MDGISPAQSLKNLPVAQWVYLEQTGSTNDDALRMAQQGAPHGLLVVAGEQTAGRGRLDRRWVSRPGGSLSFSLLLRPAGLDPARLGLISPLGALALALFIEQELALRPLIKWPNDVLLEKRKVAGILAEAVWSGERLDAVVLGMGVNIAPSSVPADEEVLFPAGCLETFYGKPLDRWNVLRGVLERFFVWLDRLESPEFFQAWESRLAFKGEPVRVSPPASAPVEGLLAGIDSDGALVLTTSGGQVSVPAGDVSLRPAT